MEPHDPLLICIMKVKCPSGWLTSGCLVVAAKEKTSQNANAA
jgi:hypothetical protein